MDRRQFLKGSALALTIGQAASAQNDGQRWVLENGQIAWHLQQTSAGVQSAALENRISGRRFALETDVDCVLTFAAGHRLEIPWWDCQYTDQQDASFAQPGKPAGKWSPVFNLAAGRKGRIYDGSAWFRHTFRLPESARGREIVFVLGGYDQQDWKERWVYVNGHEAGHSVAAGRWREPGRYRIRPSDPLYASLRFGADSSNLLAVHGRGCDFRFGEMSDEILERYVFRPFLFDQFISIGEPYRTISRFEVQQVEQESPEKIRFVLRDKDRSILLTEHYELNGFTRRKWLEIRNESKEDQLLLDAEVERFGIEARCTEGGQGIPVFAEDEAFFALEHPAAMNQHATGKLRMWHCPGRVLQPGESLQTSAALAGVSLRNQALQHFHSYITSKSPRAQKKHVSIYTCYGVNNQWGGCPALADGEVLNSQRVVKSWQSKGVKFDYFTLDQGWPDNAGDLTEFAAACYPDGPQKIVDGVSEMGMKFGLWFSVSGGGWSDGEYPAVQSSAIPRPGSSGKPPDIPPVAAYRNGYPSEGGVGRTLCVASRPYFEVLKNAVVHHVEHNQLRLLKLDIGDYYCNSTHHDHVPGKYSNEAMFNRLIDIAQAARAASPDMFVAWYWGVGDSPFWALHGDAIFESGLFMEGSGTSWYPSLYYRDSVTLSLDQSTRFARLVPPLLKDSLGVWISQIRWANFMGKSRWRESLVMDLGRGSLIFPQMWGDPNLLNDDDIHFLAQMTELVRRHESTLLRPRLDIGDAMKNEPYAYVFLEDSRGLAVCHNMHFASRKIQIPLPPAKTVRVVSHFPERAELLASSGSLNLWLRPFETLLLEITPTNTDSLPRRQIGPNEATTLGRAVALQQTTAKLWMDLTFADAERFEKAGMRAHVSRLSAKLPPLPEGRSILAIPVRLQRNGKEYRHKPVVAEIVQMRARLGAHDIQMHPVPDARQYGNTQSVGSSWVVYKFPLSSAHSEQAFELAIHSYLPEGVEAVVETWLVQQWWTEESRPEADGYYAQAPS